MCAASACFALSAALFSSQALQRLAIALQAQQMAPSICGFAHPELYEKLPIQESFIPKVRPETS